jgi:hypothetical protein
VRAAQVSPARFFFGGTMSAGQGQANQGMTSLSFLQSLYGDEKTDMKIRIEAAKAALPYEHTRESAASTEEDVRPLQVTVLEYGEYLKQKAES